MTNWKNKWEIGQKFNKLTIIDTAEMYVPPNCNHRRTCVKVQCDCGEIFSCEVSKLTKGKPKSCFTCSRTIKRIVSPGDKFDKLTVVEYVENFKSKSNSKYKEKYVKCICECGGEKIIRTGSLVKNETNNCGCDVNGSWKGFGEISGIKFYRIQRNAEVRDIKFELNIEQIWELFLKQNRRCALSGIELFLEKRFSSNDNNTASLDRIDSKKHYEINNVHWVHKDLNKMKMDFDLDYFLDFCKKITDYNLEKNKER
jgi:hypothetical protein